MYTKYKTKITSSVSVKDQNATTSVLLFQRCIVMRRLYISYKQVKMMYSLSHAYALICGWYIIIVN